MIEEALGMISLNGQKPSCLMRMRRKLEKCNLTLDNNVIKHRLMKAMPISVDTALAAQLELPVDQFVKLADTNYRYSNTVVANLQIYSLPQHNRCQPDHCTISVQQKATNPLTTLFKLNRSVENAQTSQQLHINYFAENVISCKPWCQWSGQRRQGPSQLLCQSLQQIRQTDTP